MICYSKTMTCTKCGFKHTELLEVRGDFDGWDVAQLMMNPPQCPFCIHQKKLAKSLPAVDGGDKRDAERYRWIQKATPYRFRKIQDASVSDGGDVFYFHKDRFDAAIDAAINQGQSNE